MAAKARPVTVCPLCGTRLVVPYGDGPFALVGDQPGWKEKMLARPLVGETGELLAELLRLRGHDLYDDFWMSNLWGHDVVEKDDKELAWHTAQLKRGLAGRKAALLMGSKVVMALTGQSVAKTSGLVIGKLDGTVLMASYNPAALFKEGEVVGEVHNALDKFVALMKKGRK